MGCPNNDGVILSLEDDILELADDLGMTLRNTSLRAFVFGYTGDCPPEDELNEQLHYIVVSQPENGNNLRDALNSMPLNAHDLPLDSDRNPVPIVLRDVAEHYDEADNTKCDKRSHTQRVRPRTCCECSMSVAVLLVNANDVDSPQSKIVKGRRFVRAEAEAFSRQDECCNRLNRLVLSRSPDLLYDCSSVDPSPDQPRKA